ncbi:MAG TPA: site-2 protease family protein [Pyrinomonadaceae bacterium]|nr:site-2 protease family protein [Pyrinomonadaceae bacterium]
MSESVEAIPTFVPRREQFEQRSEVRPTAREWLNHAGLLFITFLTTTFAGVMFGSPEVQVSDSAAAGFFGPIVYVPDYYVRIVAAISAYALTHPTIIVSGLTFSLSLLFILTAHEMGHYLACRRYGVDATLPFFIPAPPMFLAGTFGAFIKMKSPIPSRRALFDIGLAGPLAGFVALLPIAVAGVLTLQAAPPHEGGAIIFNDPLLIRMIARLSSVNLVEAMPNSYYMAAWIGLLVTSLNLMPVGQLDGGHGSFALFGDEAHKRIGFVAFVSMALIAVLGFVWYGSPSGFLYTVLLAVMLKVRHPAPRMMEPLGVKRTIVAVLTLLVFALSFWPFPIAIT